MGLVMTIPFASHNTASDPHSLNNNHRLKLYRKFMGVESLPPDSLDIGTYNFIGIMLGAGRSTVGDLNDWCMEATTFNIITCFEVIQHVMNPLSLVEAMHRHLDDEGRLYIATPKQWLIPWYHGKENFVEYKPENLEAMFKYVGFEVLRRETHNPWPLRFMFYGVRPFFRVLLNRFVIWELRKP